MVLHVPESCGHAVISHTLVFYWTTNFKIFLSWQCQEKCKGCFYSLVYWEYCLSSDKTTYDWCKQFKTFIHDIVTSHRFCVHSNLTVEYINGHKTCGLWWWFISAKAISILPHIYEVWIEMVFTKKQKHHINYLFRIIFDLRRFL